MDKTGVLMRSVCQPKFKVPDSVADDVKQGKFAEDKNTKCYIHCVLEMMQTVGVARLQESEPDSELIACVFTDEEEQGEL